MKMQTSIFRNVGVCCFLPICTYLFENGAACHNSGFPVAGTGLGYTIIQVWARVPCVTRACAVDNEILILLYKKKAAGPKSLGPTLSLGTRVRATTSVPTFFRLAFFLFFPICFFQCLLFAQIVYLVQYNIMCVSSH